MTRQKDKQAIEHKKKIDACAADLFSVFSKHIDLNHITADEFMLSLISVLFAMMQSKTTVEGTPIPFQIELYTKFLKNLYRDNKALTDEIYRGLETVEK